MIIYNVTIKIDKDVHDEWLQWMKTIHIPEVMETGCFIENKMCRILVDDEDGINYSIQYTAQNMANYLDYMNNKALTLQKKHTDKYLNKFVAFRTLLQVV